MEDGIQSAEQQHELVDLRRARDGDLTVGQRHVIPRRPRELETGKRTRPHLARDLREAAHDARPGVRETRHVVSSHQHVVNDRRHLDCARRVVQAMHADGVLALLEAEINQFAIAVHAEHASSRPFAPKVARQLVDQRLALSVVANVALQHVHVTRDPARALGLGVGVGDIELRTLTLEHSARGKGDENFGQSGNVRVRGVRVVSDAGERRTDLALVHLSRLGFDLDSKRPRRRPHPLASRHFGAIARDERLLDFEVLNLRRAESVPIRRSRQRHCFRERRRLDLVVLALRPDQPDATTLERLDLSRLRAGRQEKRDRVVRRDPSGVEREHAVRQQRRRRHRLNGARHRRPFVNVGVLLSANQRLTEQACISIEPAAARRREQRGGTPTAQRAAPRLRIRADRRRHERRLVDGQRLRLLHLRCILLLGLRARVDHRG